MIDIALIRENPEEFAKRIATKVVDVPIDDILRLDELRRNLITDVERIKAERNAGSKLVGKTKDPEERNRLIAEMKDLGDTITETDERIRQTEAELTELLLGIPNLPDEDVPVGADETANVVASTGGPERELDFTPRPHWEIAEELGIIDFERGVKLAGTRGYVLKGDGARLQRALIQWMLDVHTTRHGYSEVDPPYQVLSEMLVGTGQLPKFADTLFHDAEEDKWLIPTAEVPVTNMYRDEILPGDQLPIYHVAATPSFRREQISAGRDVRGIKRVYQFMKVELVKFVTPEESANELGRLMDEALYIVDQLGLKYRVLDLSTGDMTFGSAHTYDIEAWAPGSNEWLEISSCSNMRDFQARRANLKFRPDGGGRPQFLHTLNGSGLALPRVIIAIIENYQRPDGTIEVPEVLRGYFGERDTIGKQPPAGPSKHEADA
ncbi:MAG TPA: serine--tRNA ligase [Thermomicrobiales bacterium]|nr:serine--tRNA ligase [Thermomicrobiales bacterium]